MMISALALISTMAAAGVPRADSVPLYTNLGNHHHKITTSAPRAQQYFDQGLRLIYAFNHAEAIASFKQALRYDADCAMCYWGIAHAYGPNINAGMEPDAGIEAYAAARKAMSLAAKASPKEQAFIRAIAQRYAENPVADRANLDSAFAGAMREVHRQFPRDEDAAVLYADALMNLSPWQYWTAELTPRPGTQEMLDALRPITEKNLQHAGACHLYIHAVEAAFPKRAEPCADRLAALMPGAGHIVHMPGHIYIRIGRYADAIAANRHAIHEDESFIADRNPTGVYPLGYYPHNYHFLNFAALMAGNSEVAAQSARDLAAKVDPELLRVPGLSGSLQHYSMAPLFTHLRFEQWQPILAVPAPPADLPYATGLWRYTRGVAHARSGQAQLAQAELVELRKLAATPELQELYIIGYNSGAAVLELATEVLAAEVAAANKSWEDAARHLQRAGELEDAFVYIEPPEWVIPSRHTLGTLMLAANRPADARRAFEQDLERFPENVWALRGLHESLTKLGNTTEAAAVRTRLEKATAGSSHHEH
jgi:tetratricopeptide (TPR) repeat protein